MSDDSAPWLAIQQFMDSQGKAMAEMNKKMELQDAILRALVKRDGKRIRDDKSDDEDEVKDESPKEEDNEEDSPGMKVVLAKMKEMALEIQKLKMDKVSPSNSLALMNLPDVDFPAKFKMPSFTKFEGRSDPSIHLMIYASELGPYEKNEALKVRLFDQSLTGNTLKWYVSLDRSKITKWKHVHDVFMGQYKCLCRKATTKYELEKLKKKPTESIQEFAARWNEKNAEIIPPLDLSEMGEMFVDALEPKYYGNLIGFVNLPFHELVEKAELYEKSFDRGKMRDTTITDSIMDQIQTGAAKKKRNEGEVSAILPAQMNQTRNWNATSGNTNAGNRTDRGKTWNMDRVFTPLGDSYENILALLVKQKMITNYLQPPNHDPNSKSFRANERCTYHSSAPGHPTERCWALKHRIQDLIDAREIVVQADDAPNVKSIPKS